jgi:predicted amidophosphoribosyltransferase
MSDPHAQIETERRTVEAMIGIFCRGRHGTKEGLCPDCGELRDYAARRLEQCPLRANKPKCSACPVHCYKPAMRERIREVMRYAGPRMLYRHPILTGKHYLNKN